MTVVSLLPALSVLVPLLVAGLLIFGSLRPIAMRLAPWTLLPGFAAALLPAGGPVEFPWVFLGLRLNLDDLGRTFLLFSAPLWGLAAAYAAGYLREDRKRHRFFAYFLLAAAGNIGLIVAADLLGYYLFFAVLSVSGYGIIVHEQTPTAFQAGRVYIMLVVLGELLLFPGVALAVYECGNVPFGRLAAPLADAPHRDWIVLFTFAGFGIKAGAIPLHVWLPLAHPAAPTPASAVLSGVMIKAGLLGWLRVLPGGIVPLEAWGQTFLTLGLAAAVLGVAAGTMQSNPKTVLAYSSISQMGLMTVPLGIGMIAPAAWPYAVTAAAVYAFHHALAKSALFLGVGVARGFGGGSRRRHATILVALALPAAALAGAPLSGGAAAKAALKGVVEAAGDAAPAWVSPLLPLTAVGTTVLMLRFLFLARRLLAEPAHGPLPRSMTAAWGIVTVLATAAFAFAPGRGIREAALKAFAPAAQWASLWPLLAGLVLTAALLRTAPETLRRWENRIPPGDILVPVARVGARAAARYRAWDVAATDRAREWAAGLFKLARRAILKGEKGARRFERNVERWPAGALGVLVLIALLFAALAG